MFSLIHKWKLFKCFFYMRYLNVCVLVFASAKFVVQYFCQSVLFCQCRELRMSFIQLNVSPLYCFKIYFVKHFKLCRDTTRHVFQFDIYSIENILFNFYRFVTAFASLLLLPRRFRQSSLIVKKRSFIGFFIAFVSHHSLKRH